MPSAFIKVNQADPDELQISKKEKNDRNGSSLLSETMEALENQRISICSPKNLLKKLPILDWFPKYSSEDLLGDAVAGFTVALTVIPQGIAYALVAGLPPNYGLYSAFMGSFLYMIFGSCKDITIGPTAIMAILTYEYCKGDPNVTILIAFTSGLIILAFGLFNLGFLISFISKPVISGFTSAAAITIFSSQLKGLFGIKIKSHGTVDTWIQLFSHISETRWQDLTLGVCCIVILLFLKGVKDFPRFRRHPTDTSTQRTYKTTIFLISVSRNALVVILAMIISMGLDGNQPFSITGDIKAGLPHFHLPPFSTNNGTKSFSEIMTEVGSGVIIIPLVSILESIAIASAFAKGKSIDATQEMIALGLCNLGGSFVQSMPTTGSFSRTAVNSTSGVRTPAGGAVTGLIILLALAFLTPYFKFIPIASMCAVIISAVVFMIEFHEIGPIWRTRKSDQLVLWTTFLVCLLWKLEFGIVLGVLVNLGIFLIVESNPSIDVKLIAENTSLPYVIASPLSGLQYLNADRIRFRISKIAQEQAEGVFPVVLDCSHFSLVDFTGSKAFQGLYKDFKNRGQSLLLLDAAAGVQASLKSLTDEASFVDKKGLMAALGELRCSCHSEDCALCSLAERRNILPEGGN